MLDWTRERHGWKRGVRRDPTLSDATKLIAVALCDDFAHHETAFCNPAVGTICDAVGKSPRTVLAALAALCEAGWITRTVTRGRGRTARIGFELPAKHRSEKALEKVQHLASSHEERVQDRVVKGARTCTPIEEPYKEPKEATGETATTQATIMARYREHRFTGNVTDGLRCIRKTDHGHLTAWATWLASEHLPKLCDLPLAGLAGKKQDTFFSLPTLAPPTCEAGRAEALAFFEAVQAPDRRVLHLRSA